MVEPKGKRGKERGVLPLLIRVRMELRSLPSLGGKRERFSERLCREKGKKTRRTKDDFFFKGGGRGKGGELVPREIKEERTVFAVKGKGGKVEL